VRRAYAGSGFFRALLSETGVGADGVDELARLPLTTTQRVHDHRTH
jgi:phenylacetate-coenzyme A ligase PaaK-like adenylate-forming protein